MVYSEQSPQIISLIDHRRNGNNYALEGRRLGLRIQGTRDQDIRFWEIHERITRSYISVRACEVAVDLPDATANRDTLIRL